MRKKTNGTNKQQKGLSLTKNKAFFGSFFGVLIVALIISGTFAWSSYAKWLHNHMQTGQEANVKIAILGDIKGNVLTHATPLSPKVKVKNIGDSGDTGNKKDGVIFVRVSLEEVLMQLEIDVTDQTGNGHLKPYTALEGAPELLMDVPKSWVVGARYHDVAGSGDYYKGVVLSNYAYRKDLTSRPTPLGYLVYSWGIIDPATPPLNQKYWLYDEQIVSGVTKGYFYYSKPLQPGESTALLLDTASLNIAAPNDMKGSLYRLDVKAEGSQANESIYEEWGISKTVGNPLYDVYKVALEGL